MSSQSIKHIESEKICQNNVRVKFKTATTLYKIYNKSRKFHLKFFKYANMTKSFYVADLNLCVNETINRICAYLPQILFENSLIQNQAKHDC